VVGSHRVFGSSHRMERGESVHRNVLGFWEIVVFGRKGSRGSWKIGSRGDFWEGEISGDSDVLKKRKRKGFCVRKWAIVKGLMKNGFFERRIAVQ